MADEPESVAKFTDLLEKLKLHIKIVGNELEYYDNRCEYQYREILLNKLEKMELVKTSLDALILKTNNQERQPSGRSAAAMNNDSGYGSENLDRRNAVLLREEDVQTPERNFLGASIGMASTDRHCSSCLQQIKSPVQVTEEHVRFSTENEDLSECQSSVLYRCTKMDDCQT